MPRVYLTTLISGFLLGILAYNTYLDFDYLLYRFAFASALLLLTYANEKKAFVEDRIHAKTRRFIEGIFVISWLGIFTFLLFYQS